MPKFEYNRRSSEDVKREASRSSGRYDSYLTEDVTWFRPTAGENIIRLMPWNNKAAKDFQEYDDKWGNHWGIPLMLHRNVGPDNGSYLCLKMKGEPCPICDAYHADNIDELKAGDRVLCWLIDRDDEKAGPKLWSMPLGVSKDISNVSEDKRTKKLLYIDDWEEGYDVFFDKEGEKARTQYKRIALDRDPSRLGKDDDQEEEWLSYIFERRLPDLLKFYEPDHLEKVLSGQKERGDGDGADRRGERASRRRSDDRGGDGDREETTSRGRSSEDDRDERPRGRRAEVDSGDREERTSRGRSSDESGEGSERPSRRRGEEANGRDRDAEKENEGREAREASEAQSGRSSRRGGNEDAVADDRSRSSARERLKEVGRRR